MKLVLNNPRRKTPWIAGAMAALALAVSAPAFAVDGVVEINQAKVTAAGGFPFTISSSGSYRLTGNLTGDGTHDVIDITASQVTLDLNGFTICCTIGSGINASGVGSITVLNGAVTTTGTGPSAWAINLGQGSRVEGVHADSNTYVGILVGDDSVVRNSTANNISGAFGIVSGNNCVLSGNTANGNGYGILATGSNSQISNNTANNNSTVGINTATGTNSQISNNTANNNSGKGIATGDGDNVSGNTASNNYGSGIVAGAAARVTGNTVNFNSSVGITLGANGGYANNVLSGNAGHSSGTTGQVFGGISMGAGNTNLCNGVGC